MTLAVQARVGWEFGGRVPKEVGVLKGFSYSGGGRLFFCFFVFHIIKFVF